MKRASIGAALGLSLVVLDGNVMAACPALTTLSNGTTADATPVNGNFSSLLNCANALAPLSNPSFAGIVSVQAGQGVSSSGSFWLHPGANSFIDIWPTTAGYGLRIDDPTFSTAVAVIGDGPSFFNAGNFGFGTNAPGQALTVVGANGSAAGTAMEIVAPGYINQVDITPTQNIWGLLLGADPATWAVSTYHGPSNAYVVNVQNGPLILGANNSADVTILGSGYVGIGTTSPTALLTVNGAALATAWNTTSDIRTKTDVRPFDANALAVVASLKPVSFLWKDAGADRSGRRQIGFIAQDVMPVLPDVVRKANDAAGTLSLNYAALVPVLTKAIQEQQAEIAGLKVRLASTAADVVALRERATLLEASANRKTLRLEAEIHQIAAAQRIRLASSESVK